MWLRNLAGVAIFRQYRLFVADIFHSAQSKRFELFRRFHVVRKSLETDKKGAPAVAKNCSCFLQILGEYLPPGGKKLQSKG
jgi:hypothetical protein